MVRDAPKIHLYHATAPTCWWSWGYEAVLNRLPLVYGDQVEIHLRLGTVYEDRDAWLREYGLTFESQNEWAQDSAQAMGLPLRADYGSGDPVSVLPATLAVLAARKQGEEKGARFMRAVLRRFCIEGEDVTRDASLEAAAKEAGLNAPALLRDYRDTDARRHELEHQGREFPHVPLGFYNLALTDGEDRTVLLDNAFDPAMVEGAIDYLADGQLAKRSPTDVVEYLRRHGPAPLRELSRVFGWKDLETQGKLMQLEKERRVATERLAGALHWRATNG